MPFLQTDPPGTPRLRGRVRRGKPTWRRPPFQRLGHVKSMAGALAATGALIGPAYAWRMFDSDGAKVPMLWHRAVTRAMGVRSTLDGPVESGAVLYVLNHLSWLDIPVVGGHLKGSFVAKAEVEEMGLVGRLADIQRTIYVDREQRSRIMAQTDAILERLASGGNVILFPEGTSNDGVRVLPFKSSLFSVLEGAGGERFRIQPLSLAYTEINGLPLTRNRLIELAWIGDLDLAPHLVECSRMGRIRARILPHPAVRLADFGGSRKALARHCQIVVAEGYRAMIRGSA